MPYLKYLTFVALLFATPALAQEQEYHASNGQIFYSTRNDNGAVLKSKYPVSVYTEAGAASTWVEETDIIYLGKSCDAFSKQYGDGSWAWANGGFVIEFEHHRLGFPRQDIDAGAGGGCQM